MRSHHSKRIRLQVAELAAKLIYESGYSNHMEAKNKAAMKLGINDKQQLPSNDEIETALMNYQALYHAQELQSRVNSMYQAAYHAMTLLEDYRPYLTGSLLTGCASQHTEITLHVYSDAPELIGLKLNNQQIPTRLCERRVTTNQQTEYFSTYTFIAGDNSFAVIVLPDKMIKSPPIDNVSGKKIKRVKLEQLKSIMEENNTLQSLN